MFSRTLSTPRHGAGSRSVLSRTLRLIAAMASTRRHRRALGRLDSRLLQDIGLTTEEAQAELARPIWDVPGHWRS